jgi:hypothetical protein
MPAPVNGGPGCEGPHVQKKFDVANATIRRRRTADVIASEKTSTVKTALVDLANVRI